MKKFSNTVSTWLHPWKSFQWGHAPLWPRKCRRSTPSSPPANRWILHFSSKPPSFRTKVERVCFWSVDEWRRVRWKLTLFGRSFFDIFSLLFYCYSLVFSLMSSYIHFWLCSSVDFWWRDFCLGSFIWQ